MIEEEEEENTSQRISVTVGKIDKIRTKMCMLNNIRTLKQ